MKKCILIFILLIGTSAAFAGGPNSECMAPMMSYVNFITTAASNPSYLAGRLFYDKNEGGLAFMPIIDGPVLQIGQEQWIWAANNTGADISNGSAVYIDSAIIGIIPEAKLAKADATATSDGIAVATHDIPDGTVGFFTSMGKCSGINTTAWSAGDSLYLSVATAGALINTIPATGSIVRVGKVLTDNASGAIFVNPRVSGSLEEARFFSSVKVVKAGCIHQVCILDAFSAASQIADNGVSNIPGSSMGSTSQYDVYITNGSAATNAKFWIYGAAGAIEVHDPSNVYSVTKDTDNSINVYVEGGYIVVQNMIGYTAAIKAIAVGTPPN